MRDTFLTSIFSATSLLLQMADFMVRRALERFEQMLPYIKNLSFQLRKTMCSLMLLVVQAFTRSLCKPVCISYNSLQIKIRHLFNFLTINTPLVKYLYAIKNWFLFIFSKYSWKWYFEVGFNHIKGFNVSFLRFHKFPDAIFPFNHWRLLRWKMRLKNII